MQGIETYSINSFDLNKVWSGAASKLGIGMERFAAWTDFFRRIDRKTSEDGISKCELSKV